MTKYLPRFTLRRALIAIALLALFLGWLRPDRARVYRTRYWSAVTETGRKKLGWPRGTMQCDAEVTQGIELSPIWPNRHIVVERVRTELAKEVSYHVEFRDPYAPPQP